MTTKTIEIDNISYRYTIDIEVLKNITLSISPGERVALLGHNGSGKSTLAKHLNGLLLPRDGEIRIHGIATTQRRIAQLAHFVALLFQNPNDQICKRTVRDEVAFGPQNLKYSAERVEALVNWALDAFNLSEKVGYNPHDLGYGERKRLALASVLAMDTEIIVLDEPTVGLDPKEVSQCIRVLRELETKNKIVIVISHDMDFIARTMTRAVCLEDGCKRFDGSLSELFDDVFLLEQCGLLLPQIAQLSVHYGLHLQEYSAKSFIDEFTQQRAVTLLSK
ncbi:energy-coupling factor ABC transporter ATP-binding protein [Desulfovibrio inopinatus]|uniref:energy-coupling factor ABC transporter ATP-binding protein n=1 Tax=Desulfovibrio inopinatus TaxID=102109 RepID=UPI000402DFBF|nr:ABC transporter ATP-binding protein [Desulfovibrio inopinatus]